VKIRDPISLASALAFIHYHLADEKRQLAIHYQLIYLRVTNSLLPLTREHWNCWQSIWDNIKLPLDNAQRGFLLSTLRRKIRKMIPEKKVSIRMAYGCCHPFLTKSIYCTVVLCVLEMISCPLPLYLAHEEDEKCMYVYWVYILVRPKRMTVPSVLNDICSMID
jgi:hypothetical protein